MRVVPFDPYPSPERPWSWGWRKVELARICWPGPTLPAPIRPSTLPVISTPMKRFFSHFAGLGGSVGCGQFARQRQHQAMACSAVVMELPNGVFIR